MEPCKSSVSRWAPRREERRYTHNELCMDNELWMKCNRYCATGMAFICALGCLSAPIRAFPHAKHQRRGAPAACAFVRTSLSDLSVGDSSFAASILLSRSSSMLYMRFGICDTTERNKR